MSRAFFSSVHSLFLLSCVIQHCDFASMGLKVLLLACLRLSILAAAQTVTWATTIPNILSAHSELSTLSSLVNSLPLLVQQFNSADNFTFLAPTNAAISSWLATNRSTDYIQAALQYHLLKGTYPSVSIPSVPVFIPSSLTNKSYCNITGGQRVKASNTNGNLVFGSALQTTSNALSVVNRTTFCNRRYHSRD